MTLRDGIFDQSAPFSERSRPLLVAETKPLSDADARKLELTMHALFGLRAYECVWHVPVETIVDSSNFQYPAWLRRQMY